MEIIKEREHKTRIWFTIEFNYKEDPYSGFSFDCDKDGKIDTEHMNDGALENYNWCLEHPEKFTSDSGEVAKHEQNYTEPAIGRCVCGTEVPLEDLYMGACQCPKCGQWYNLFGQSLIDPEYWEDDY